MDLKNYLSKKKAIIDRTLSCHFPKSAGPLADIISAMKYSLLAGGKRLRPILCMAGSEAVGGSDEDVLHVACALEIIHTFSLIHDDLPAMDNDETRRGKPTSHKVFGEATALLAGDGLLIDAFNMMAKSELNQRVTPEKMLKVIGIIAHAAGYQGMVGGQQVDIQSEGKAVAPHIVEFVHTHKTGALITSSVVSGALLGGGDELQIRAISTYGEKIGLAFQIADDILDIEGDSKLMGKEAGADGKMLKITYPSIVGFDKSKTIQSKLVASAIESIREFDSKAEPLRQIARYIINRKS